MQCHCLSVFQVKQRTVVDALTQKTSTAGDETFTVNYRMEDVSLFLTCFYNILYNILKLEFRSIFL